jgi:hypothetical protein
MADPVKAVGDPGGSPVVNGTDYWPPDPSKDPAVLIEELDHLASCANILLSAIRDEDPIAFHYGVQGTEFAVMRAAWLNAEGDEAERLHGLIGDHSPDGCPVCVGARAFTIPTDTEPLATPPAVSGSPVVSGEET